MERWEVILEAGIEGGSIRLYGMHTGKGWIYCEDIRDQTPELVDEPGSYYQSKPVYCWESALELLDKHPWQRFYPLEVHSLFRGAVLAAVLKRSKPAELSEDFGLSNWLRVCGAIPHVEWKLVL